MDSRITMIAPNQKLKQARICNPIKEHQPVLPFVPFFTSSASILLTISRV